MCHTLQTSCVNDATYDTMTMLNYLFNKEYGELTKHGTSRELEARLKWREIGRLLLYRFGKII